MITVVVNVFLIIACSLDPNGVICQAYGGPCVVMQQSCPVGRHIVATPENSHIIKDRDIR